MSNLAIQTQYPVDNGYIVVAQLQKKGEEPSVKKVEEKPAISKGELKYELVSVEKTGSSRGDGSPEVVIKVRIENLPEGAHTLTGFIGTNQDWPAGVATTKGKTSGTFEFLANLYPSHTIRPFYLKFEFLAYFFPGKTISLFYIKIADKNGNQIGRVPEGECSTIKVQFPAD